MSGLPLAAEQVTIDRRTALAAADAISKLIASIKNDSNEFRREVGISTRVPLLQTTLIQLENAVWIADAEVNSPPCQTHSHAGRVRR